MRMSFLLAICFIIIIVLQNAYSAQHEIDFDLRPSVIYRDNTTKFIIELIPNMDLNHAKIEFYVDASKIGAKELPELIGNKSNEVTFEHYFDDKSYIGEHYIEIKINSSLDKSSLIQENYLTVVNLKDKEKPYEIFAVVDFLFLLISCLIIYNSKDKERFSPNIRATLFSLLITVLPIGTSFFISIVDKPLLKIDLAYVLSSLAVSYIICILGLTVFEGRSGPDSDTSILYSLVFLFLGLINMIISVILSIYI